MILTLLSDVSPARTPVFYYNTACPQNLKAGLQIHANYPLNNCAKQISNFQSVGVGDIVLRKLMKNNYPLTVAV